MDERILDQLSSSRSKTSAELALTLNETRVGVNQSLERLEKEAKIRRVACAFPVSWEMSAPREGVAPLGQPDLLVLVDLGNTHDCLPQLLPYCRAGLVEVRAYADLHFSGFVGDGPMPCFKLIRAASPAKNAADVDMIWDLAIMLSSVTGRRSVIVASKDKGFLSLENKVTSLGHSFSFVTKGWADLKLQLE
jgi:hypothetical protein